MTRDSLDFYKWRSLNNEFVIHILTMVGILNMHMMGDKLNASIANCFDR